MQLDLKVELQVYRQHIMHVHRELKIFESPRTIVDMA